MAGGPDRPRRGPPCRMPPSVRAATVQSPAPMSSASAHAIAAHPARPARVNRCQCPLRRPDSRRLRIRAGAPGGAGLELSHTDSPPPPPSPPASPGRTRPLVRRARMAVPAAARPAARPKPSRPGHPGHGGPVGYRRVTPVTLDPSASRCGPTRTLRRPGAADSRLLRPRPRRLSRWCDPARLCRWHRVLADDPAHGWPAPPRPLRPVPPAALPRPSLGPAGPAAAAAAPLPVEALAAPPGVAVGPPETPAATRRRRRLRPPRPVPPQPRPCQPPAACAPHCPCFRALPPQPLPIRSPRCVRKRLPTAPAAEAGAVPSACAAPEPAPVPAPVVQRAAEPKQRAVPSIERALSGPGRTT